MMRTGLVVVALAGCGGGQPATQVSTPPRRELAAWPQDRGPNVEAMAEERVMNRLKVLARTDPIALFFELEVYEDEFEGVARQLYKRWAAKHPEEAKAAAPKVTAAAPRTPASFVDENGVTVLFNDHKWFCFKVSGTSVTLCAKDAAQCIQFAEAMKSAPSCGVREAATCINLTDTRTGANVGKCFETARECQAMSGVFVDKDTRIDAPCMTLRYRGY